MDSDPIGELLGFLQDDGVVPPAWLARWTADGTLRAAWRASNDGAAMLEIIALAWGEEFADAALAEVQRRAALSGAPADADGVRDVAAEPPALSELWRAGE